MMPQKNDESQVILALQAMQNDPKLSARAAGKKHDTTTQLSHPNPRKLTDQEETIIIQHILDLSVKRFPPWLSTVGDRVPEVSFR